MEGTHDDFLTTWGWADDQSSIEVSVPADAEAQLQDRWPPCGLIRDDVPVMGPDRTVRLVPGVAGTTLVEVDGVPSDGSWERVESELALFAAERLAGVVAVHAAAIADQGQVLLIPGATGIGKSSLCIAAAASGASVLSDEFALVDPRSGLVTGWMRPVRVRRPGGIDRLDIAVPSAPAPVGLVALVRYHPTARNEVVELSGADAVMGLLANTVCARSRPDDALDAALCIARSSRAVRGERGEAEEAILALLRLMAEGVGTGAVARSGGAT